MRAQASHEIRNRGRVGKPTSGGEASPVHTPVTCRDLWVPEGIAEHVLLRKMMYVNAYCTLPNDKRVTILLGHVCYQPRAKILCKFLTALSLSSTAS